jgi:hypothetical protein
MSASPNLNTAPILKPGAEMPILPLSRDTTNLAARKLEVQPSVFVEQVERAALIEEIKSRPVCPDCSGYMDIGKNGKPIRCRCHRYDSKKNRPRQDRGDGRPYEKGLQAAHYYQLNKTIKSGAWAKTGYRRPRRSRKSETRVPWFGQDNKAIAVFLSRCDLAAQKWRDEFAGLMRDRVALRLRGMEDKDASSWLDLSRREIAELDGHIKLFIPLPRSFYDGPIPALERKTKRAVASDILRRRRLGIYKQGQVLLPQRVNPLLW